MREYKTEVVDEKTIRDLIEAAVLSPNAVNQQPWIFTIVLDRISCEAKDHLLPTLPEGAESEHFRSLLTNPDFHIFYHAPALIVISGNAPGPWIVEDCALAAENLMLAAFARGLGTCWIGFSQSYFNTGQRRARAAHRLRAGGADNRRPSKGRGLPRSALGSRPSMVGVNGVNCAKAHIESV